MSTTVFPSRSASAAPETGPSADRPWLFAVALAVFAAVLGLVLVHFGFKLWVHTYDEDVYRVTGRQVWDGLPSSLWQSTADGRGLQRLQSWVLAFGVGIFGTPGGFKVVRVIDIVAYLSTAAPVFLWVRAFGVGRLLAALAGALAILVPWAVVTTTFMTEAIAYPATTWALYAIWRFASRPTLGWLVRAGVAILVAMLARSVMLLLAAVLVLAVVAVAARFNARGAWGRRNEWTPREVAPWALLGGGVLFVVALYLFHRSTLQPLTGIYTTDVSANLGALPRLARQDLSYVISGLAILPGIVAVGWIGRSLVKPASPESLALAVIAVAIVFVSAYSNMRAGPDERYMMYLAPPLVVAAAVAIGRREIGPLVLAAAGVFTLWLFSGVPWKQTADPYDYYVLSAQVFHGKVLLLGIGSRLPDVGLSYSAILALGIAVTVAIAAYALWRGGRVARVVAVAFGLGILGVQLAQTVYTERHFTREANFGPTDVAQRSWVDNKVGEDAHIGVFVTRTGADVNNLYESWREVAFFNQAQRVVFQTQGSVALDPLHGSQELIFIDEQTGRLRSKVPIPHLMLQLEVTPKAPLAGKSLAYGGYVPFSLVDTQGPARLKWHVTGNDDASWTVPHQPAKIRVYRSAGTGGCLTVVLQPPPDMTGKRAVTVRSGGRSYRASVPAGGEAKVEHIRLAGGDADAFGDVTITAKGTTPFLDGPKGVRVASVERTGC